MINEENLNKMYDGILEGQMLTTKKLNEYGFNSKDLRDLINDGTLERVKRGYYSFKNIDDLLYYDKKLIAMKKYDKVESCFERCHELDLNHKGASLQLFLRCIQNRNYEKALEYFDCIFDNADNADNADNVDNADCNYYLYLLSMITELPEKYRQYAKFLKIKDISVDVDADDKRYNEIYKQNKIRMSSLNQRFVFALKQLSELIEQNGKLSVQDVVTKELLCQAKEEQINLKKHINELINQKQYKKVIDFLETLQEQRNLNRADQHILTLTKDLMKIMKTGKIPRKQVFVTDELFDAIDDKKYELALSLSLEYTRKNSIMTSDNSIYMLLTEIKSLIDKQKISVPSTEKKALIIEQQEEQSQVINQKTTSSNEFDDVTRYLMKNDLDSTFIALRNYLDSIKKQQYEFLLIDLIKISITEKDTKFTKPIVTLIDLAQENFKFDISEYVKNFYQALALTNFDQARIYLDIISKSNNLVKSGIVTEFLEQALDNTEQVLGCQKNNEVLNKVDEQVPNTKNMSNEKEIVKQRIPSSKPFTKEKSTSKEELKDDYYNDVEFINQKLEKLYEKGIILLKPMDSERTKRIHNIVKSIPDVKSFSIVPNDKEQIVLRFSPYIDSYVNLKELIRVGKKAYIDHDYDTCIDCYRSVLEYGSRKAFVYAQLGLAYMKKCDTDTAIDYLTVATELSKNTEEFDFTELLADLKGLIAKEDNKPYFKMSTSDFKNDLDDHYGIEQVEQIAELISSGMTLDDACSNLGLDGEQKSIVTLIIAKECYAQEKYTIGDYYLKNVERTKNKSKFTKSLFEEVRNNKKFYKNRVHEGEKRLVLTPKIKK